MTNIRRGLLGAAGVDTGYPEVQLQAWGDNGQGQLGVGDTTDRSSPVNVGSPETWHDLSASTNAKPSVAAIHDGKLFTWGNNEYGQLGLSDYTNRSSPTQVGSLETWATVSMGSAHCVAIKTDGTMWSWGKNEVGALGQGDKSRTVTRSSPVQIGSGETWSQVSVTSWQPLNPPPTPNYGQYKMRSAAVTSDGKLFTWGGNGYNSYLLGNGSFFNEPAYSAGNGHKSAPSQVGSITTWKQVWTQGGRSMIIKTDGTMWTWGEGAGGASMRSTSAGSVSIAQIGSDTDWEACMGSSGQGMARKTDGTLYVAGSGQSGQLGLGGGGYGFTRNSPSQVGSASYIASSMSNAHSVVVKDDGTLWTWGENSEGQLGVGNTSDTSSPVQVGSGTSWTQCVAGEDGFTLATYEP